MSQKQTGTNRKLRFKIYQNDLDARLTDEIHKRIIKAYDNSDPVRAMENELGKILLEVLDDDEN